MAYCPNLCHCGFFGKYKTTKDSACNGVIGDYCGGPKKNECKRKEYKREYGVAPPNDMLPNGAVMSA
jgi:hypothetical protein